MDECIEDPDREEKNEDELLDDKEEVETSVVGCSNGCDMDEEELVNKDNRC